MLFSRSKRVQDLLDLHSIHSVRRLVLIGIACAKYYDLTWSCSSGGDLVRVYLIGEITFLVVSILFMLIIVRQSAKGSIMETQTRKYVEPLLTVK